MLPQLCDDAIDTVLRENNGVARKWGKRALRLQLSLISTVTFLELELASVIDKAIIQSTVQMCTHWKSCTGTLESGSYEGDASRTSVSSC